VTDTKWFVKMPDGDTYDGRIYNGKVYELIPEALPNLTIEDGRAYIKEGLLEYYPGLILDDSDSNAVLADEGKSVLKYMGGSDNLGGYINTYYTATSGKMKASITKNPHEVIIDLDSILGDVVIDRQDLRSFFSFIATALISNSLASVNLQNAKYKDYIHGDKPVPVNKPMGLYLKLGRLPVEKQAGL